MRVAASEVTIKAIRDLCKATSNRSTVRMSPAPNLRKIIRLDNLPASNDHVVRVTGFASNGPKAGGEMRRLDAAS